MKSGKHLNLKVKPHLKATSTMMRKPTMSDDSDGEDIDEEKTRQSPEFEGQEALGSKPSPEKEEEDE